MAELFQTGRIVDVILALMLVEAVVLSALFAKRGRGIAPLPLVLNFAAGAALLLALRAALLHSDWRAVALWLIAAFAGHLGDMLLRSGAPKPDLSGAN